MKNQVRLLPALVLLLAQLAFSQAPSLTSISPTSVLPGTQVTLTGSGFGTVQGSGGVTFNNMAAASIISWSDTQVVATVANGTRNGLAYVAQNGVRSNGVSFTMTPPTLTSISPTTVLPGTQVTLTGSGFGAVQGTGGGVTFNNMAATSIISWSDTHVVATVANGTRNGLAYVSQNAVRSNGVSFTMTPPTLTSISPTSVLPGTQVTLTGSGFGAAQGSGGGVTFNNMAAASIISWSDTQVVAIVANGTRNGLAYVAQNGVRSNGVSFTMTPPTLSSISPTSVLPGTQVTLTGSGFGAAQGSGGGVTFNNMAAASIISWSDTQVVATVANGTRGGLAYVSQNAVRSNGLSFSMTPPTLTSISPTSVAPGMQVTLTGSGFGSVQGTGGGVTFNNMAAASIVSWSDTQVVATVANGTTAGSAYVSQNAVRSNGVSFTITQAPLITSISPNSGTIGTSVTISGTNLGSGPSGNSVAFNGTVATATSWSPTSIVVPVPSGATSGNIVVTLSGLASNGVPFTVIPTPVISSVSPNSSRIGATITITGTNFGAAQGTSTVTLNGVALIPTSWSDTSVVASVPIGAITGNVVVTVNGQVSNGLSFTVVTLQSIAVTPASQSTTAGARQQFVATGTYSDGSTQNFTAAATWISSAPTVAPVNNTGLSVALAAGTTTIQASVGSISGSASFTVSALPASGPPLYPRFSHTATRLNDGTVLLIGGTGNGSDIAGPSTVAVAELYNQQTGAFSATGSLITPRFSHTASLLNDGTVLVAGGYDDDGDIQASAEVYNPISGTFIATGSMSTPRVYHTATVMSGLVLLAGGLDGTYNDTGSAEVFNSATGAFTATGSLIVARDSHTATLLNDGTVLIAGGSDENSDTLASTEIYNPATGVFTAGANMNVPRRLHTATLLNNGKVLIVGGFDENGNAINSAELYDPQAQTFTLVSGTLANARANPTATLLEDGTVLIAGGTDQFGTRFSNLEQFDPVAGTFNVAGNMMACGRDSGTATRLDDGSVLLVGGQNCDFTTEDSAERFQPTNLTPPNLVSIMLSPLAPTIPGGTSQGLAALGTFSDNSIQTLASSIWTSSDNTLATVTSDVTNQGEVYGVAQGTPEIIACAGAVCGSTTANITAPLLQITGLSPNSGDIGTPVTISGTQFGSTAGTVTFNGTAASIVSWTPTAILVNVPSGATSGNVIVSVNGMSSNGLPFTIVPRPQISGISPAIGVAGTQVTVTGVNFGASQGGSVITFNGTAGTVVSWSNSTIVVSVPDVASTGNVVVTVAGLASNGQLFTIPVIGNINPFDGPPGILLTIAGSGFGAAQGSGTAMVGSTPISVFTWSDSQIVGAVGPGTTGGNVTVQQGGLTITGPSFTVDPSFPYTITPQSLSMVVGDSRTVSAVDSQGNTIKGLDWFATDTTIVSLSTDDPPVITALAPGSVTVYAGDVPLPINVYASTSAMPPGTPIWSVPVGNGSGLISVTPAVPSDSGADVFAFDSTGTLTALASDGGIVWKQSGIASGGTSCGPGGQNCVPYLGTSVIPDFSGSAILKTPYSFQNSPNSVEFTHKVQYVNRTTGGVQNLYTFSDVFQNGGIATDANTQDGRSPVQTVIPHPTGPVFVQDTSTVSVIDPSGTQPTTTISLLGANHSATDVGKMIVAGDGNAYVPYLYGTGSLDGTSGSGSGTESLMLLRISPDGSNATTQLGSWSGSFSCVPWTAPNNTQGTQCSISPVNPSLGDLHVITNADQGVAVFVRRSFSDCAVEYLGDPQYPSAYLLDTGCGDFTHNHMDIYYVAQDAVTSQVTDAAVFPNDLSGPLIFVPELQREDGSYIGSDSGLDYVMAMGAGGGILWQYQTGSHSTQDVPARPLYATADGGVIFTTSTKDCAPGDITTTDLSGLDCISQDGALPGDPNFGQLGTIYTLDQNGNPAVDANGNPIPPAADTGAAPSWTGEWYVDPLGSISELNFPPLSLAGSFWPIKGANASTNAAAVIEETLYVRNFAPWPAFGPDPLADIPRYIPVTNPCLVDCFLGDNRGFTTSVAQDVTSRINGIVQVVVPGMVPITARAYSNQSTAIYRLPPINKATAKPTITKTFDGTTLTLHMAGADPLVPLAPDVDTHLTLTGTLTPGQICYSGHLSGDPFPNTEVFVVNSKGHATTLVDFATPYDRNTTGLLALLGDNNLDEGSFANVCTPK